MVFHQQKAAGLMCPVKLDTILIYGVFFMVKFTAEDKRGPRSQALPWDPTCSGKFTRSQGPPK
ncbi:hypothetical protein CHH80_15510 [Bacillus sp. 7504-2]|nr:hypothetical protein CHH80_15510 [Bacillus sp. 7504-2]